MVSPRTAQEAGIAIIYQEFNLVPDLTSREDESRVAEQW